MGTLRKIPNHVRTVVAGIPYMQDVSIDVFRFSPLKEGRHNALYRFHHPIIMDVVLRIAKQPEQVDGYYEEELHNHTAAHDAGLATELLHFDLKTGTSLYPFQMGRPLTRTDIKNEAIIKQIIGGIQATHAIADTFHYEINFNESLREYIKVHASNLNEDTPPELIQVVSMAKSVLSLIEKNPVPYTPCHGDLHRSNILRTQDDIVFIDWQLSGMGDPHVDLASFFYASNVSERMVTKALTHYFQGPALFPTARVQAYLFLKGVYWAIYDLKNAKAAVNERKHKRRALRRAKASLNFAKSNSFLEAMKLLSHRSTSRAKPKSVEVVTLDNKTLAIKPAKSRQKAQNS